MGNCPSLCPLLQWASLWLIPAQQLGFICLTPRTNRSAAATRRGAEETDHRERRRFRASPIDAHGRPMNAQQLLQEISDYCRQTGLAESTFGRRAVNDGKLAGAAAQRRPHHHRHARPHPRLHGGAPRAGAAAGDHRAHARGAPACRSAPAGAAQAGRPAAQFPLLRQPPEIPAVRQHLQREMGGRAPRFGRARSHPSATAGGARVRRRRRRRHRAGAGDARDARSLSAHAVLHGRQGDQSSKTSGSRCRRCRTGSSNIRRRCWC